MQSQYFTALLLFFSVLLAVAMADVYIDDDGYYGRGPYHRGAGPVGFAQDITNGVLGGFF